MATEELLDFLPLYPAETEEAIRARWEAWANEGLTPENVDEWQDVREGSFFQILTTPGIREAAKNYDLLGSEVVAAAFPLWSWSDYLDSLAEPVGVERLSATVATGVATFYGTAGSTVPVGTGIATEGVIEGDPAREFQTVEAGVIQAALGAPPNLAATGVASGGTLNDDEYFYVVTTVNDEGESDASAEDSGTVSGGGGSGSVDLDWDAVVGATAYRVYRALATGGPFDFVIEVATNSYTDDGSPLPDSSTHPPATDTTGDQITLAIEATEPGSASNVDLNAISILRTPLGGVTAVANPGSTLGGSDPETDEGLRDRVLAAYGGQGPGTSADYIRWASAYAGVGRVSVIPIWDGPGTVLVVIMDADNQPVSQAIVDGLQEVLDPDPGQGAGLAPIGAIVTVKTGVILAVDVEADVELDSGYSLDGSGNTIDLTDRITAAVVEYFETIVPGSEIVVAQVLAAIVSVTGVHDAASVTLNASGSNVNLTDDPPQVPVLDDLALTEAVL